MASAASNVSVVEVPGLGDTWPSGEEVRIGTADDAEAAARWESDSAVVNGALDDAVKALKNGSSETMVYVVDDAHVAIGVVTIGWKAPYLLLVFIDEPYRRCNVGTKAVCIVIDEFFQGRPEEQWLGVMSPISEAGERLLLRLGFFSSGSGMRITRDEWGARSPAIVQFFDPKGDRELEHEERADTAPGEADEEDDEPVQKVAIDVRALHVVSDEEAREVFRELLGQPEEWNSPLVRYRMTSAFQDDWVIEVGNWLARARSLGFVEDVLQPDSLRDLRAREGQRDESDPVHRTLMQWLAQAMVPYYFLSTGWAFGSSEPGVTDLRADGTLADVDLQLYAPGGGPLVDMQVKGSGTLGRSQVDEDILEALDYAITQLPDPPLGAALVVICAQRSWWLSADVDVVETLIGSTSGYGNERVLLHDDERGRFATASHVSGVVILDHRRSLPNSDYGCTVLMNPWATYELDPAWFPHARVLSCHDGVFSWIRGAPHASTFPTRTRFAPPRVVHRFEPAQRRSDAQGLHGSLATTYTKLWHLSDEATPPVCVLYELDSMMPDGALAYFATGLDDRPFPHIRVARPSCPDGDEPDLAGADLRELISLASVRGYEASWRAGTYGANTMPEMHRAWDNARALLQELGFDDWAAFEDAKQESLEGHRLHKTPE